MANVSFAMQAKSDQLNAVDIVGSPSIIRIRAVEVRQSEQPVWIYFDGDNNRPWKPSKGMIRVLSSGWGDESDNWIGKLAEIYCDTSVIYAGKEVGGIRVSGMSDIPRQGLKLPLTLSKSKRTIIEVRHLDNQRQQYPADQFEQAFPKMVAAMQSGKMTLQHVIGHCQKTGDLTPDQLARLEQAAPVEDNSEQGSE